MAIDNLLTPEEKRLLESARKSQYEIYGLEHYSRLWDSVDTRLGRDNEVVKELVQEYQKQEFLQPRDHFESRRIDMIRNSFVFPRTGMPEDVRMTLLAYDIKQGTK